MKIVYKLSLKQKIALRATLMWYTLMRTYYTFMYVITCSDNYEMEVWSCKVGITELRHQLAYPENGALIP